MAKKESSYQLALVTSREGRVSRNYPKQIYVLITFVTSREGRVSRNIVAFPITAEKYRHVPRGTCE